MLWALTLFPGVSTLMLALWGLRYQDRPGGKEFVTFAALASGFSLIYCLELAQKALPAALFWGNVGTAFGVWLPGALWLFVCRYTDARYKARLDSIWFIPPVAFNVLLMIEPWAQVWRANASLAQSFGFSAIDSTPGPGQLVFFAWAYALITGAILKLLAFRSRIHSAFRWRITLLSGGILIPVATNVMHVMGYQALPHLDLTPLTMAISSVLIGVAIGAGEGFDVLPVAREHVFERIGEGVVVADRRHQIVDINRATENMLGRTAAELLRTDVWKGLGLQDRRAELMQSGSLDFDILNGDRVLNVRYTVAQSGEGEVAAHIFVLQDVTERKREEQGLRESRDEITRALRAAEAASLAKSEFLANMSHEMRTPLNGILGVVQILERQGIPLPVGARLNLIRTSAESLLALINDLLDLASIENGKLRLTKEPFVLDTVLRDVAGLHAAQAESKQLKLSYCPTGLEGVDVVGDRDRLRQVLHNLVANAIKFTDQGSVEIRAQCVRSSSDQVELLLEVVDTGIGIAPELQESIFDSFVQVDSSVRRRQAGVGLGLSIARRIVQVMGGTLTVWSEPSVGSTFKVVVPLELSQTPAVATTLSVERKPLRGMRILMVEDNLVNRLVAKDMLESLGCHVLAAADGLEAIDRVQVNRVDAVLMDVHMPKMDGIEATRCIRRFGIQTPIFAMTASAMSSDREACREAGMNGFLPKPLVFDDLLEALGPLAGTRADLELQGSRKSPEAVASAA